VTRRLVVAVLALVGACLVLLAVVRAIPDLNPFGTETVDRSQPAVLKSIERIEEFRAATANLQVIVDVERDTRLLPDFLKGERTLFVAAGTVDAGVDLRRLREGAVRVNEDRTAATITLPAPRLYEPRVDPSRSRVYDRDRGLLDRLESVFEDSPVDDRELFALSERKLLEAARADRDLLPTARRNIREMLTGLLRGLGFRRVTVRFEAPPT
jgi:hypothetical protein